MQQTISDLINGIIANIDTTAEDVIIANIIGTETNTFVPDATTYTIITSGNYVKLYEEMDEFDIDSKITLTSEFTLPQSGVMLIDTEEIQWTSFINNSGVITLYDLTRGFNSTTPAAHLIDTTADVIIFYRTVDTSYYNNTFTPGDSTAIMAWRLVNYEDAHNQAHRSQNGMVITDSNSPNYPLPDWDSLIDNITTTGGLAYGNGDWIKYEFPDTVQLDRLTFYISAACNCYFAWSPNDVDWTYVGAEADHTLTSSNKLVTAASSSAAATNYWAATNTGGTSNSAQFPVGVRSKYVKIFLLSSITIYDLVYTYIEVKSTLAVDYLSAISADVGLLTAGVIQSSNFDDGGVQFDLDNDVLKVYDAAGTLRVKLGKLS